MTEYIDARLTNRISGMIDDFIAENGEDSVKIYNGLDIEKVRLFTGKNGGSAVRFFDILSSNGDNKISQVIDGKTLEENFVVIPTQLDNEVQTSPMNTKSDGNIQESTKFLRSLGKTVKDYTTGLDLSQGGSINTEWLQRVRQYMNVMDDVFGFNTPEQLEVFMAAWCSEDSTTRLTGIPGTGKTTLIECASMLFANAYGFNEMGAPMGQKWSPAAMQDRQLREDWEATRFDEESYQYPFSFLLNKITGDVALDSIKNDTEGVIKQQPSRGLGGALSPSKFVCAVGALSEQKLLFINGGGIPSQADDNEEDKYTYIHAVNYENIAPDGSITQRTESKSYLAYPVADLQKTFKESKEAWAKSTKKDNGEPLSENITPDEYSQATWFYKYGSYVSKMLEDLFNKDSEKVLSPRQFIGKWYYDIRTNDAKDSRSIDNEMRREIGTAKIDKDKRAEQVHYGVQIQSKNTGYGSQYVFEPYPRPIVTQPAKFFNDINRSQPGVADAILGLIAEKEVEYRGDIFNSPNFVAWMDNNPHVGGNDLAFTDRVDIELLFPSALLDQRYKVLKAKNAVGERVLKPRQRVLEAIKNGKVTPMRFEELKKGVWKDVNEVQFQAPGYNALMDIAIVSMLFSQRFAIHPDAASISGEGIPPAFNHQRLTGEYNNSIKPLTSSGYFVDASVTETESYRNNITQSRASMDNGHGAMTLITRVLAFRFTNSLAKFARSLAWLRGNRYVTRKEVMDMLPYVVGHRIGRARGENNRVGFGISDEASPNFQAGQEFVREAIVEGYISRNIDSFLATSGVDHSNHKQSRWIEWDSMIAAARNDLASAPTYADYEKTMWAMARMGALGDGTNSATGDPYPYLIYRLVLMEELTATPSEGETMLHPFLIERKNEEPMVLPYQSRVEHYQQKVMDFLTTPNNYSASDIGTLRKEISIEKWLIVDDKRALLTQLDSMLDSMTGFQIPDDLQEDRKFWGMYSSCADANSLPAGEYTGLDETSVLGFPLRDFIRTFTWYGGSGTGRTIYYIYKGVDDLLEDKYPTIKQGEIDERPYPQASKLNAQQSTVFRASVSKPEESQGLKNRIEGFMSDIQGDDTNFAFIEGQGANCREVSTGTADPMSVDEIKSKIYEFIDSIQQATSDIDSNDLTQNSSNIHYAIEMTHSNSNYGTSIVDDSDNKLVLYISAFGDVKDNATRKTVNINICLASSFCNIDENGDMQIVSVLDTAPLGESPDGTGAISSIASTFKNDVEFTFFDLGNITIRDIREFTALLNKHRIG